MSYINKGSIPVTVMVSREPDRSGNWVCDGTADDVQINAAIVYANALGGGIVFLKASTNDFSITSQIEVTSHIILEGPATIIFADDTNEPIIEVDGDHIEVKHLTLDGNKALPRTVGGIRFGIWVNPSANREYIILEHLIVKDTPRQNIYAGSTDGAFTTINLQILRCDIRDSAAAQAGIVIGPAVSKTIIYGNNIYEVGHTGVDIWQCEGDHYIGFNRIIQVVTPAGMGIALANSATGAYWGDVKDVIIEGNYIEGCEFEGIYGSQNVSRITVINNTCIDNGRGGIYFTFGTFDTTDYHPSELIISENRIIDSVDSGISFNGAISDVQVLGNYVSGAGGNGISFFYSEVNAFNAVVDGNIVKNSDLDGIDLRRSTDVIVTNNRCYDDQGTKTQDYGISEELSSDWNVISNNNVRGNDTGGLRFVGANTIIKGNVGYNVPMLEAMVLIFDDSHAQVSLSYIGDHMSVMMAANQNCNVAWGIKIPPDFHSLVAATLVVVPTAADPTLRFTVATDWGACGEAYNANTDAVGLHDEELVQNDLNCIDLSTALTNITAGDIVGFNMWRNGADAADDAGDTHVLMFYIQYV